MAGEPGTQLLIVHPPSGVVLVTEKLRTDESGLPTPQSNDLPQISPEGPESGELSHGSQVSNFPSKIRGEN